MLAPKASTWKVRTCLLAVLLCPLPVHTTSSGLTLQPGVSPHHSALPGTPLLQGCCLVRSGPRRQPPPSEGLLLPTPVCDARPAHQTYSRDQSPPRNTAARRRARELLPAGVGLCVEASWMNSHTLACDLTIRKWKQTENVVTMENLLLTLAQGSSEACHLLL